MNDVRDHRNLDVYRDSRNLIMAIYRLTAKFPTEERFGLTSQMRRSAVSVSANIVEGCARSSTKDCTRFLEIAFGSLRELGFYLELAQDLRYTRSSAEILELWDRTSAALLSLIRARRRLR